MLYPICQNGLYGFIFEDASIAIRPQFVSAMSFSEGLAGFQDYGKWGFINARGEIVIEPRFDSCRSFAHGLALVEVGNTKQYIDKTGQVIIRADFHRCGSFEGDLAPVVPDPLSYGAFIDRSGQIVLSEHIHLLSHLSHGLINAVRDGKWGYMSVDGKFVIAPRYSYAHPFREGLAAVAYKGDKDFCFIDTNGQIVIEGPFNGADIQFSGNRCAVWNKHFGFINRMGQQVIPYRFYYADHFSGNRAVIKEPRSKFYGYIDEAGEIVLAPKYQWAGAFNGSLAQVIIGKKFESFLYGYIDRTGKYIWQPSR